MKLSKLTLNRETIRQLNPNELQQIGGAKGPILMEQTETYPEDGTISAFACQSCRCPTGFCTAICDTNFCAGNTDGCASFMCE